MEESGTAELVEISKDRRTSWARAAGLTPREAHVLAKVALGLTNKQIGRELGISGRTVTKHLENAFPKLGVTTRTAAAALYVTCSPRLPPPTIEKPRRLSRHAAHILAPVMLAASLITSLKTLDF